MGYQVSPSRIAIAPDSDEGSTTLFARGDTIYYGSDSVSSTSYDGTLADGDEYELLSETWFVTTHDKGGGFPGSAALIPMVEDEREVHRRSFSQDSSVLSRARPFIQGRMRLRDRWSATDFSGVQFDGDDEGPELKTAIEEARDADRTLYLPQGVTGTTVPLMNSAITNKGICLKGEGLSTVIESAIPASVMFSPTGVMAPLAGTLSANAEVGDTSITLTDVTGVPAVGGRFYVMDTSGTVYGNGTQDVDSGDTVGGNNRTRVARPGEWLKVKSVNTSTKVVEIYGSLTWALTIGTTVRVVTSPGELKFHDILFRNVLQDGTQTNAATCLKFTNFLDVELARVRFDGWDSRQVLLVRGHGVRIFDSVWKNARNDERVDKINPYMISCGQAVSGVLVANCVGEYGRHFLTAGGDPNDIGAQHITVQGGRYEFFTGAPCDSHPGARFVNFIGNTINNATGYAFQHRSPDCAVINNVVNGALGGAYFVDGADRGRCFGNSFLRCDEAGVTVNDTEGVMIEDNYIYQPGQYGIWVRADSDAWAGLSTSMRISRNRIIGTRTDSIGIKAEQWLEDYRMDSNEIIMPTRTSITGYVEPALIPAASPSLPVSAQ